MSHHCAKYSNSSIATSRNRRWERVQIIPTQFDLDTRCHITEQRRKITVNHQLNILHRLQLYREPSNGGNATWRRRLTDRHAGQPSGSEPTTFGAEWHTLLLSFPLDVVHHFLRRGWLWTRSRAQPQPWHSLSPVDVMKRLTRSQMAIEQGIRDNSGVFHLQGP